MTFMPPPVNADTASSEHPGAEEELVLEFGGGVDLQHPPHKLAEGYCRDITNMYFPRETSIPRTRPGLTRLAAVASSEITAVGIFRQSETVSYTCFTTIEATVQKLYYLDGVTPTVISSDLGSLLRPDLTVFNGCLLVSIAGKYIREWQGYTGANAAVGTATVTFTGYPANDQTITVGAQIWTWKTATTDLPFQITIPTAGGGSSSANALVAAINRDSSIVIAVVHGGDPTVVHVSARRVGTAGNLAMSETCDNTTISGNLTGGVNGLALDQISTNGAPQAAFTTTDQNQRLVASGDPSLPDTVFWSSPEDHWQWATGVYGGGETFQLGYRDGTDITAIHSMLGTLVVHKSGQGREIYRVETLDPIPTNWTSGMKKFHANTSALNQRCVAGVTDKFLFLDTRGFSVMTGSDTYDEIVIGAAGAMVAEQLARGSKEDSFFVVNPDENCVLVFRNHGNVCWVFHYGSGRWTRFNFNLPENEIGCGCYDDSNSRVVFGTMTGVLYTLTSTEATDNGLHFSSEIVTRSFGNGGLRNTLIKQVMLDWEGIVGGSGTVGLLVNNELYPSQELFDFTIASSVLLLKDATFHLADWTMPLVTKSYGRINSFEQGSGEIVALQIKLNSGAFALNGVALRVAYHGRVAK